MAGEYGGLERLGRKELNFVQSALDSGAFYV
jgi:hypothetical protein